MTDRAFAGAIVNGECTATGSLPQATSHLHDGSGHEPAASHGAFSYGDQEAFTEIDLNYLVNVPPCEPIMLGVTSRSLTGATARQATGHLVEARRAIWARQVPQAFSCIARIEPILGDLPPDTAQKMWATANLLRAIGFASQDDMLLALHFARSAIKQIGDCSDTCAATTICRLAYWKLGDLDNFFSLPRTRLWSAKSGKETPFDVFDLAIEAAVEFDQLRFSSARHLAQDALGLAAKVPTRYPGLPAFPASLLAQLLYEQGSLDEAEHMIVTHLPAIREDRSIESTLRAYPILARIAGHGGQHARAATILEEAGDLAKERNWHRLAAVCIAESAGLLLADDRAVEATACADALQRLAESAEARSGRPRYDIHHLHTLVRAKIALNQSPSRGAVAELRQLQRDAVGRQDLYEALRLAIGLVDALAIIGEESEALAVLIKSLSLGSAVGVYQTFLDGGAMVKKLLRQVYDLARTSDVRLRGLLPYVGCLLDKGHARETANPALAPKAGQSGILSERERMTLQWMSHGLSNKGIAKKLGVTPETVKSHAKKIFLKLVVKTRAEAVSRASGLGLI